MDETKGPMDPEGTRLTLLYPATADLTRLMMVLTIFPGLMPVAKAPLVALVIRVAWPGVPPGGPQTASYPDSPALGSSSSPGVAVEIASTVMFWPTRFAVALASVTSKAAPDAAAQTGSCPGASPNQTIIRLLPLRHPMVPPGGSARLFNANRSASGISPPPKADHTLMPAVTAAVLLVGLT